MKTETNWSRLVHELRERMGLTQERFAARLGVAFPTINRWENGHAQPSPLAQGRIQTVLRECGDAGRDLAEAYFGREEPR